jgi:uncharacterized membrane protein YgcG
MVVAPQASVTAASVAGTNDSMLLIVAVCLAFYAVSATVSAAIGAVMHLSGRSLQYATRGAANWSSAGILDTFDIMRLPLAYEIEEPVPPGRGGGGAAVSAMAAGGGGGVVYVPWDGPESSYIPVSMVKVMQPGLREAGLVARPSMLRHESSNLRIISVTRRDDDAQPPTSQELPGGNGNGNGNGNGKSRNGNGKGSSSNGNSRGGGDDASPPQPPQPPQPQA